MVGLLINFMVGIMIGVISGLIILKLTLPGSRRRWMKNAMLKYGAMMDHCPKCVKRTPFYYDGASRCLYCETIIGTPKKLIPKGFRKGPSGLSMEFEVPTLRPNEIAEGGF